MLLQTDEQTIEDLGIFGKRDSGGIFELYNRANTRGGESLLRELFRHPLSDREAINERSEVIAEFARLKVVFPFDAALFDMAGKYLTNMGEQTARKGTLSEREIQNGVASVISIIQGMRDFVVTRDVRNMIAYAAEREAMIALLDEPVFEPVLKEGAKGKTSYTAATAYDVLFRFREREKIEALFRHIYALDVYSSVARVAVERGFIFPVALEKGAGTLRLEGLYHPELAHPVPNDLSLIPGRNVVFLTGANMAGKSTFLRALSTAVYIAHLGFPVAAASMTFSVMDGMYTTINLPDNLGIGASHFYAEVLRLKKVATDLNQGQSLFVLFDELFRGTNVKDAHEATVAVTKGFAVNKNSMFIISSHIVEAAAELGQRDDIVFLYLPTRMNGHTPEYTYTLEQGITDDRHGMIIIRNERILDTLKNGRR